MISDTTCNGCLEEKRLNSMKLEILKMEQKNLKTKEKSNEQMVDSIRKIIADEINRKF